MRIVEHIFENASTHPKKVALTSLEDTRTYLELKLNVEKIACYLQHIKIPYENSSKEAPQVALYCGNSIEFVEIFLGAALAGWVTVILDPDWTSIQLESALKSLQPILIFTNQHLQKQCFEAAPSSRIMLTKDLQTYLKFLPEGSSLKVKKTYRNKKPLFIGFTSGTTSAPKGFIQSHKAWSTSFKASHSEFDINNSLFIIAPGPLSHGLTFYAVIEGLHAGASVGIVSSFQIKLLRQYFETYHNIVLVVVPSMLYKILNSFPDHQPIMRVCKVITAGSKLDPKIAQSTFNIFPRSTIYEYYGASEIGFISVKKLEKNCSNHSIGFPFQGVEISIRNQKNKVLEKNSVGTIWVKNSYHILGYVAKTDRTGFKNHRGWVTVGDQGHIGEDNQLYLIGRKDNMIITGGLNVYPEEVEEILKREPLILNAFVYGVSDLYWGMKVCALIRWCGEQKLTAHALKEFCKTFLPAYKCPKSYFETLDFPLTRTDKVNRYLLHKWLLDDNLIGKKFFEIH